MSFTLAAKVMNLKIGSMAKKMVLLKLADQANDDGICWPSYQTIADACEVSRRTVIRHIKSLEQEGYLEIHKSYDKTNKRNYSNKYRLTLEGGDKKSLVTNKALSGDTKSPPSDTVSPKPTNEPIKEPIKAKPHSAPDDFKPTDKQLEKMKLYGIDADLLVESFISRNNAEGKKYKCWNSALTTWINNEIKWGKLQPIAQPKPSYKEFKSEATTMTAEEKKAAFERAMGVK